MDCIQSNALTYVNVGLVPTVIAACRQAGLVVMNISVFDDLDKAVTKQGVDVFVCSLSKTTITMKSRGNSGVVLDGLLQSLQDLGKPVVNIINKGVPLSTSSGFQLFCELSIGRPIKIKTSELEMIMVLLNKTNDTAITAIVNKIGFETAPKIAH